MPIFGKIKAVGYKGNVTTNELVGRIKPIYYPDPAPYEPTISGELPFTFNGDASLIKKYDFRNSSNNTIGTKTINLVPDLDGWIMGKALSSYGDVQDNKPTLMISDFIEVEPSTSYKFGAVGKVTNEASTWHRVVYFDENKANISFVDNNMGTSFTTPATAKYLRLCTTFWYQPFLVKSSDSYTYVPYGYNIPIVLNNTTYHAYLPETLGKKLSYEDADSVITFNSSPTYNYSDGGVLPGNSVFKIYSTDKGHYNVYAKVPKAVDIYIKNTYGSISRELSAGTYTLCLTVHNPPITNTWSISCYMGNQYAWRGCICNSENVTNGVGTAYLTFTVDDTDETQVGYVLIRLEKLGEDDEWYQNVIVDARIIEGTEPVFTKGELTKSNNEVVPVAELPRLVTADGSNTIDVDTSPKPTKVSLLL